MELKERERIIKDLQEIVDNYSGSWKRFNVLDGALALIKELTEENGKLNERLDREARCQYDLCGQIVNLYDDVKYVKAETVRKIQQRLTSDEFYIVADDYDGMQYVDFCAWVEEIAKELLEENDV
jgi:predicted nuclease with TOPRIM domain